MLKKLAIVVGDTTDHGGTVTTGARIDFIDDLLMVFVDHDVFCPLHGWTTVKTGQRNGFILNGRHQAAHGDLTSCGARLVSKMQGTFFINVPDDEIARGTTGAAEQTKTSGMASPTGASATGNDPLNRSATVCDERFKLVDSHQEACGRLHYALLQGHTFLSQACFDSLGNSRTQGTDSSVELQLSFHAPLPATE